MDITASQEKNGADSQSWHNSFREGYEELFPARSSLVNELELFVQQALSPLSPAPRVKGRIKSFKSYSKKYIRYVKDGLDPTQINDVIGIRIICLFIEDIAEVEKLLREKLSIIDVERKAMEYNLREFGYDSLHLIINVPEDMQGQSLPCCKTAEIQIRTIMQDAWAEVEHELIYKTEFAPFDTPLRRKLAAVNASLFLADIVFQEIRGYQQRLNGEIRKRRDSFFQKIEETADAFVFTSSPPGIVPDDRLSPPTADSLALENIDDLLLEALSAHNKNQFSKAIAIYTRILDMKPVDNVSSLIYKHRGIAYFTRSLYEEAISDFSQALELDPKSYKAAYYKGIVCTVLKRYPQAIDAFNLSLTVNPYQAYCLYRRAQVYYHLEDYPQALGDCEAALALEPFDAFKSFKALVLDKLKL
ncbi:MAG: tetratricopeptide repeat protein [Treponema sp.]|nr:tetratricopeptide repeat protein [Treponema sp.]